MTPAALLELPADVQPAAGEGDPTPSGEREDVNPAGMSVARKVRHIVSGALPAMTVATVIPLSLFYGVSAFAGMKAGIVASLAWAYLMLGRQILLSRRMSGVLTITAFTLTVRCITWVVHQSAFTYFVVPVFETIGMSLLFVVTLALGRPLLVSLARDFVPSLGDRLSHSDHKRLVRDLSCVWGAVYLGSATSSAVLLQTQSMHLFLLLHQMSGWIWTGSGVLVTVLYARRHAQELMTVATSNLRVAAA
ncbi:MAG TPA: VC0807 family protein [Acidimicrobiales bacterium]|nr:VC0807 family protein [Acidimicrobiales bacterium]